MWVPDSFYTILSVVGVIVNILSFNVCGLKYKLILGDFNELIKKYDIVTM